MSLHETTSRAEALSIQCATAPDMNAFQPIAVSAVEVCRSSASLVSNATHSRRARMEKLAAFVVNETERVIDGIGMPALPLSSERLQDLERVEVKLDEIRRTIERMPLPSKKGGLVKNFTFDREMHRLERELKSVVNALLNGARKIPAAESTGISPMELANLSIRTATAICEAPVLNFLKPVAGIAQIISGNGAGIY
ncbi:hypothetical protein MSAN_01176600 [Mycena sanguinolenta]|uniref:Uncharacterized protein n=1 Tax=Mycena sanguinolenta TaxID=230812 RepID=A0A8H7D4R9_9AGAR|nr:hypothetical protein MSAN_01176600 [Mycena sanguinolenta]